MLIAKGLPSVLAGGFTVCMMVLGPLKPHPVSGQTHGVTGTQASEGVEAGVHMSAVGGGSATFLGPGARLTIPVRRRLAFEVGLDPKIGRDGLYFVQARQTFARSTAMKVFATFGAESFSGVALPDFPSAGLGWQFDVATYAALRVDGQLLFGVREDATRVITRLSAGVAIPMRGYQRSRRAGDPSTPVTRTTLRSSLNSFAASLATDYPSEPQGPITQSARPARARVSKRKAALIGAAIGAGGGTAVGATYCRADCGGGPTRGALVFAPVGAGIGAAAGLAVALLPSP